MTAAQSLDISRVAVITGPQMAPVEDLVRRQWPDAIIARQQKALGTADATRIGLEALGQGLPDSMTLVLYGDTPLIEPKTLQRLVAAITSGAQVAVLAFRSRDPAGYGRMIHDETGAFVAIREDADATEQERAIDLCNSGVMAFGSKALRNLLPHIGNCNAACEFYLTDMIGAAVAEGLKVRSLECREDEVVGVNTQADLARAEEIMQNRLRTHVMAEGACLTAPETVFLCVDSQIGHGVVIEPHVIFGPGVVLEPGVVVRGFSYLENTTICRDAQIGPFARIRPGTQIGVEAHIGNFVEIKNSQIHTGAKIGHMAYIGDSEVGERTNIGAGAITCNYDGLSKHRTLIGKDAFVGSNSSLIAPVTIGEGAYIGSGSVISRDVAPGALGLSRTRQVEKPGFMTRFLGRGSKAES